MKRKMRRVFETDRKMELRVRLAAKRAGSMSKRPLAQKFAMVTPDREVVTRIIRRVQQL